MESNIPSWLKELWSDFNSSKNASLGKAIISMLNCKEPKDFYEDKPVGPASNYPCDLHHIFPKAALREQIMNKRGINDKEKADKIIKIEFSVDSILNQTWIYSNTNRNIISDKLPSVYLNEIIKQYGGGTIGKNVLVGMNSVVMDNCVIGDNCIIGALCFVPADTVIEDRKIVVGNPGKVVKDVSDDMIAWKTEGTKLYQQLPKDCYETLKPCEPLRRQPAFKPKQQDEYKTWGENKDKKKKRWLECWRI